MVSNSEIITRRALARARERASANVAAAMTSTVRITRSSSGVVEDTGTWAMDQDVLVYEGPARLGPARGPVTYTIGEEVQFFSSSTATIPLTMPSPTDSTVSVPLTVSVNDLLTVLAHDDPGWVGMRARVVDVEAAGLIAAGRRLQLVGVQRYPGWVDDAVRHPAVGHIPDEIPPEWSV